MADCTICYEDREFKVSARKLMEMFSRSYPDYNLDFTCNFIENTVDVDSQYFGIKAADNEGHKAEVKFFILKDDDGFYLQMNDCFYGDYIDSLYLGR